MAIDPGTACPLAIDPRQRLAGGAWHRMSPAGCTLACRADGDGRGPGGDLRQRSDAGNQPRASGNRPRKAGPTARSKGAPCRAWPAGWTRSATFFPKDVVVLLQQDAIERRGHEGAAVRAGDHGQGRALARPGRARCWSEEPGPGKGQGRGPGPGAAGGRGMRKRLESRFAQAIRGALRPQPAPPVSQPAEPRLAAHDPPQPQELQHRAARRSSPSRSRSSAGSSGRTNGT